MRKTSLDCVYELAKSNDNVVFIGSDLGPGLLQNMKQEMPNRYFMEGVSEQFIIGMAAGLAMEGFIPYINTIATFLTRRCYEQIALDLCLQNLPVRLIASGGGVVYAPLGPTHLAVEDIAIMRALPNMTIVCPCDAEEMKRFMNQTLNWPGPIYIRLAKGGDKVISEDKNGFQIGKGILMRELGNCLFITTGVMTQMAIDAAEKLKEDNIKCGVLHLHTIKPLDKDLLIKLLPKVEKIITVEEHSRIGGLGSAILEFCSDNLPGELHKIKRIGLPDYFAKKYGTQEDLLEHFSISSDSLYNEMKSFQNKIY
jgi:transketolase